MSNYPNEFWGTFELSITFTIQLILVIPVFKLMNVQKVTPLTPPNLDSSGVSGVEKATYRNAVWGMTVGKQY